MPDRERAMANGTGRLVDLAGAAADVIGHRAARLEADERWAITIDVATAARRCVQFATRFASYGDVPALRRVSRLTDVMRQLVVLDPLDELAQASLDAPIASRAVPLKAVTGRDAVDAAAALLLVLEHGTRDRTLTMRGVLAASPAAESCTAHAVRLASALGGQPTRSPAWSHAADGWRVVQGALIRFEDGSRFASATTSNLTERALALHEAVAALTQHVADAPPLAETATALRYVANQMPAIAWQIETAVTRWAETGRLVARARSLPHTEERVPELIRDHAVVVRPADVGVVLVSMRVAHRLSSALAVLLDRSAGRIGTQPQPHLIRALATAAHHLPSVERDARWAGDLAPASARAPLPSHLRGSSTGTGTSPSHAEHVTADQTERHSDITVLRDVTVAAAEILTSAPRRAAAVTYLRQRGIDTTTLPDWPLGYAPPGCTRLVDILHAQFPEQALLGHDEEAWHRVDTVLPAHASPRTTGRKGPSS